MCDQFLNINKVNQINLDEDCKVCVFFNKNKLYEPTFVFFMVE